MAPSNLCSCVGIKATCGDTPTQARPKQLHANPSTNRQSLERLKECKGLHGGAGRFTNLLYTSWGTKQWFRAGEDTSGSRPQKSGLHSPITKAVGLLQTNWNNGSEKTKRQLKCSHYFQLSRAEFCRKLN